MNLAKYTEALTCVSQTYQPNTAL